jgi:PST family polysaccharide transporter
MAIVTILLAQRLGAARFGEYAFIAAAIVIGNALTTFGSDMYLIREIASKPGFSPLSSAVALQLVLSGLFIGSTFFLAPRLPNQTAESILALRIYSLALIPLSFYTVYTSALRGHQKMDAYGWLNLANSILQVFSIALLVHRGTSIVQMAGILLGIQIVAAAVAGLFCIVSIPSFGRGAQFSWSGMVSLLVACFPIAVISALAIVYQKASLTLLSLLASASITGWFSAAARVVEAARIGHLAALTALYPAMANAHGNTPSPGIFKRSWTLLLVLAGGAAVLLFLLAEPTVRVFFGAEYRASVPMLRVLSFTLLPFTVNSYLSLEFLVEHREKALIRALFISLIALLISSLWFIPRAGGIGAGWSVLTAESLQACLLLFERNANRARASRRVLDGKGVANELSSPSR